LIKDLHYGITLPNTGPGSDPRTVAGLARAAEAAGWDGVFVWDVLYSTQGAPGAVYDSTVLLSAVAAATARVRFGPLVLPLPRRRPWKVAREAATLDHLSGGRLILPVGLGWLPDGGFGRAGEPTDGKTRAARLDEGLAILNGLWSGLPFAFQGEQYQVQEMTFLPPPVQQPRIPIWTVGSAAQPKPLARALRWDGIVVVKRTADNAWSEVLPADIAAIRAAAQGRAAAGPFDIVLEGVSGGEDAADVPALAAAGLTWWLEALAELQTEGGVAAMQQRIERGPPHVA
jgi:alkanesulfonate monooxygenase SsuD/methylene tetrahydromethanopterin reductase-like flavin-dependent oxidoreductase (luciferase family)